MNIDTSGSRFKDSTLQAILGRSAVKEKPVDQRPAPQKAKASTESGTDAIGNLTAKYKARIAKSMDQPAPGETDMLGKLSIPDVMDIIGRRQSRTALKGDFNFKGTTSPWSGALGFFGNMMNEQKNLQAANEDLAQADYTERMKAEQEAANKAREMNDKLQFNQMDPNSQMLRQNYQSEIDARNVNAYKDLAGIDLQREKFAARGSGPGGGGRNAASFDPNDPKMMAYYNLIKSSPKYAGADDVDIQIAAAGWAHKGAPVASLMARLDPNYTSAKKLLEAGMTLNPAQQQAIQNVNALENERSYNEAFYGTTGRFGAGDKSGAVPGQTIMGETGLTPPGTPTLTNPVYSPPPGPSFDSSPLYSPQAPAAPQQDTYDGSTPLPPDATPQQEEKRLNYLRNKKNVSNF